MSCCENNNSSIVGDALLQLLSYSQNLPTILDNKQNKLLEQLQAVVLANGYQVPIAFASGISLTKPNQTVSYGGVVYAPIVDKLPFVTTATFDATQWRVVAGVTQTDLTSAMSDKLNNRSILNTPTNALNRNSLWGHASVSILGDSISHGAYCQKAYLNGWANILKRMINIDEGSLNWGFVSIQDKLGTAGTETYYKDVHTVTKIGAWSELVNTTAPDMISGYALQSIVAGNELSIVVPTFQQLFRVWHRIGSSGGQFAIYVNDVLQITVDTNKTSGFLGGYHMSNTVALVDNGKGECVIRIVHVSGSNVAIMGIGYFSNNEKTTVNNFSQSGRRLAECSELTIKMTAMNSKTLIMALGHNDRADVETSSAYKDSFIQRINWLISYCNQYKVKLYVLETCWDSGSGSIVRQELKRLVKEVASAILIPMPDLFMPDSSLVTRASLQSTYKLLADQSHPNVEGNKIIAETVAKAMQTGVTSKRVVLVKLRRTLLSENFHTPMGSSHCWLYAAV